MVSFAMAAQDSAALARGKPAFANKGKPLRMTTNFLDDKRLGAAIAKVVAGSNVRCAVAFWGTGAVEHLFPDRGVPKDARIMCDLSIGSTNPKELVVMGAPSNRRLKHVEKLHAKVYISDRGAIVCSANASDNGIGFIDVAGLVEAGVFIGPETAAFKRAAAWFNRMWRGARRLDQAALDRATEAWNRRPRGAHNGRRAIPKGVPSLLASVAADPKRFRGIGFVFTNGRADEEERDEAHGALMQGNAGRAKKLTRRELQRLKSWNVGDLFTGWSEQDLDAWPRRFVCIHRPGKRISYWFYRRVEAVLVGEDRGVVFAVRPPGLRQALGFEHGREAMLAADGALLDRLFDHCEKQGHWLCENGERLMAMIEEMEGS